MDETGFVNSQFPELTEGIDLEASRRNFEGMLEEELSSLYPGAQITVHVGGSSGIRIRLDEEDVTASTHPDAMSVYVKVRGAIDKLLFYGHFWQDKGALS